VPDVPRETPRGTLRAGTAVKGKGEYIAPTKLPFPHTTEMFFVTLLKNLTVDVKPSPMYNPVPLETIAHGRTRVVAALDATSSFICEAMEAEDVPIGLPAICTTVLPKPAG